MDAIQKLRENVDTLKTIISDMYNTAAENLDFFDDAFMRLVAKYLEELGQIRKRLDSPAFYIGVIGGFSSGKSTFINAFLQRRYLVEDALQGTTCCKTHVVYAEEEDVTVFYKNGKTKRLNSKNVIDQGTKLFSKLASKYAKKQNAIKQQPEDAENKEQEILDFIRQATADEKTAKNINLVVWQSPIAVLRDGIILVDTPGLGSQNERHTEVARNAAADCDALIVLTPLQQALGADLITEVQNIAGPEGRSCIFVGTFADKLSERELPRMEKYFQTRLQKIFAHNIPFFFVSAYRALEELEGREQGKYLAEFELFRNDLGKILAANREIIQSGRLSLLIGQLLQNIDKDLKLTEKSAELRAKPVALEQLRIDFRSDQWRDKFIRRFRRNARNIKIDNSFMNEFIEDLKYSVGSAISDCEDDSQLEEYLKNGINTTFGDYTRKFNELVYNSLFLPLSYEAANIQVEYDREIRKQYKKLANEFGHITIREYTPHGEFQTDRITSGEIGTQSLFTEFEDDDAMKIGGGMAAGIAIGFVIPGVGFFIGGLLALFGGFIGSLFISLEDKKGEAIEKVFNYIEDLRVKLTDEVNRIFKNSCQSIAKMLDSAFDAQERRYRLVITKYNEKLLQDMARCEQASKKVLEYQDKILSVKKDIDRIHNNLMNKETL